MSRYQKLMTEILDRIFEGYTFTDGKLKVINERAAKKAAGSLHKLVLEKSRDLWDQLEAAEGSLADVAEEISFEELNSDSSSVDMSQGGVATQQAAAPEEGQAEAMAEPTLEGILGAADEMDFDSIFEMGMGQQSSMGVDPGMTRTSEPTMMDEYGDEKEEVVDGDEDYSDLEMGMDDNGMGSSDMEGQQGDQFGDQQQDDDMMGGQQGDQFGDQQMDDMGMQDGQQDDMMGGQQDGELDLDMGGQQDGEMDMEGGFDFDLDLDGMDSEEDPEMDEMMGKPYRMEGKGDKELPWEKKDKDDDDDDDDDEDDKKDKKDDDKDDKDED